MAEGQDRRRQQHACVALTQTEGWREVVLPYVLDHIAAYERIEAVPTRDAAIRCDAIGRKHELIELVAWVYRQAEVPSPFEVCRAGLYAYTAPKDPPEPAVPLNADLVGQSSRRVARRQNAGSVA